MFYLKWSRNDIDGLEQFNGIVTLLTEINKEGIVTKEIGLDKNNKIVHKFPSRNHTYGKYGIFDNQAVDIRNKNINFTKKEFDRVWAM